jgi:flagellar motor protein MotB
MSVGPRRRNHEDHENPAWPGLVDMFAFGMVIMLVLWAAASKKPGPSPEDLKREYMVTLRQRLNVKDRLAEPVVSELAKETLDLRIENFSGREVSFSVGQYDLTDDDVKVVQEVAKALAARLHEEREVVVLVNGSADPTRLESSAPPRDNVELSALRAAGVSRILISSGIDKCRVQVVGLGAQREESAVLSDKERQNMRRVYLLLRYVPEDVQRKFWGCA